MPRYSNHKDQAPSAQLEKCARELHLAVEDAGELLVNSNEEDLKRRPSPAKWSALECITHLNIVNAAMLPGMRQAAERAPQIPKGKKRYRMDLQGWLFAWAFEPRPFIKMKTSRAATPVDCKGSQEMLAEFERTHQELISLLRASDRKEIDREKIRFPFDETVKYTVYSAFRIIAAHDRRHLLQARRALGDHAESMAPPAFS